MRVRIAAPANLDSFFNELHNKWYEKKLADIAVRLGYTGDITNPIAIHAFIESDLTRKLGAGQTQHLRRDHFGASQIRKYPRGKCTKKVNNTYIVDYEESESDEETDEETEKELTEEEEKEDEPQNCFSSKREPILKKTDEVFHATLKSIIASLAVQCPKEILLQINAYTNQAYENLKDLLLNHFVSDYPVSERKKLWDVLSANIQDILSPLAHAVNTATLLLPTPPADLDDPNDVATISCKIKNICISYAIIDTGSDSSVISENVAKYLGLKIDRKNVHALN
ncbi:hypothetical protein C1646_770459, partial [Rhizophagus diaphanus]